MSALPDALRRAINGVGLSGCLTKKASAYAYRLAGVPTLITIRKIVCLMRFAGYSAKVNRWMVCRIRVNAIACQ